MTKRQFLIGGGSVLVILPAGWMFAGCDDDDDDQQMGVAPRVDGAVDAPPMADAGVDAPAMPFLRFTSSVAQAHTHTVTLEVASLVAPPGGGVTRNTSLDAQHLHTVALTQQELQSIQAGQTVSRETSVVDGHTHTFQFSKTAGVPVAMG